MIKDDVNLNINKIISNKRKTNTNIEDLINNEIEIQEQSIPIFNKPYSKVKKTQINGKASFYLYTQVQNT